MKILIAGGSGLIGSFLVDELNNKGHEVKILSRISNNTDFIHWDPELAVMDVEKVVETEVLINLCGAGIADKPWSKKRKKELLNSRIKTTEFLYSQKQFMPHLKQYISASGITCYGFKEKETDYTEEDNYGEDYVSLLVKHWEESADLFASHVNVVKLRIAMVLSAEGGALTKMKKPIEYGFGAQIGDGKQIMQWIHINDLTSIFSHAIANNLVGTYNALAGNATNRDVIYSIAHSLKKKIFLPPVPSMLMYLVLGKMAVLLTKGIRVSNNKICNTHFKFQFTSLDEALKNLV